MTPDIRFARHHWLIGLAGAALAVLAGCAQLPQSNVKSGKPVALVYPQPPDEARFVFERSIHGSANVVADVSGSQMKELLTGVRGSSEGMSKPYAVAVHRGRIFVSDTVARVVWVFDVPGKRHFKIGEDDPGGLAKPLGIDVDAAGNLYVADISAKAVMVYDRDGKFLRKIAGPSPFDRLTSVTVDRSGERLYAVDLGGVSSPNHRVRVFAAKTGAHLFDFGTRGTGPGEFNMPRDLVAGNNGELYLVDSGNFRIQVLDAKGKFLRSFGKVGVEHGSFARPKEASIDAAGNLYVIDTAFANFQIFNPAGQLLLFVGDRSDRDTPGAFMLPSGIFVDEDGRVYVVDQWFRKVDIFRPVALAAGDGYLGRSATAQAAK